MPRAIRKLKSDLRRGRVQPAGLVHRSHPHHDLCALRGDEDGLRNLILLDRSPGLFRQAEFDFRALDRRALFDVDKVLRRSAICRER